MQVEAERLVAYLDSTLSSFRAISGHLESPRREDRVQGAMLALGTLRQMVVNGDFAADAPPLDLGVPTWSAPSADAS